MILLSSLMLLVAGVTVVACVTAVACIQTVAVILILRQNVASHNVYVTKRNCY